MLSVLNVGGTEELRAWALDSDKLGSDPESAAYWRSLAHSLTSLNIDFLTLGIIMAQPHEGIVKITGHIYERCGAPFGL